MEKYPTYTLKKFRLWTVSNQWRQKYIPGCISSEAPYSGWNFPGVCLQFIYVELKSIPMRE